jgi:tRNA-dihydrouridine synthase A
VVRDLKQSFQSLPVIVNGGFKTAEATLEALTWCDGVMLGREAYHRPMLLAELDEAFHREGPGGADSRPTREVMLERMAGYAAREVALGERLSSITRHMLGLYAGEPGARDYRRALSEGARESGSGAGLIRNIAASLAKNTYI